MSVAVGEKPSLISQISSGIGLLGKAAGGAVEGTVSLATGGSKKTIEDSQTMLQDAAEDPGLSEATLTQLVKERFAAGAKSDSDLRLWGMYTFAGDVVVAVNPYSGAEEMAPLYAESVMDSFGAAAARGTRGKPHIFGVAAKAHADIRNRNQAIVINGESGAGKTETTKLLIKYLIHMAGGEKSDGVGQKVSEMLLASSPVFEAFGNAKTMRNDNSSRFGKYVRLQMSAEGALCGATVEKYLLEKSRVVSHSEGERSYHAFYHLVFGSKTDAANCQLDSKTSYRFLTPTGAAGPKVDEAQLSSAFTEVDVGLKTLLSAGGGGDAAFYWKTIAGVLHLGQVSFVNKDGMTNNGCEITPNGRPALAAAAGMWGLDTAGLAALESSLLTRTVQLAGQQTETYPREPGQATIQLDSLAKEVYDRLFTMLVHDIGGALDGAGGATATAHIGLLDIFGFEIFEGSRNGFEQLLINYANDKLQLFFTDMAVAGLTKFYAGEIPWRLRKGTDLTNVDGGVRAALLLTEGEEGGSVCNLIDRLNDSALVDLGHNAKPTIKKAGALNPQDKRFVEDIHTYFTGAKPKAGVEALSRRAFVKKDGSAWNGEQEYRPRKEDVSETEWKCRTQLRVADCHFGIKHFAALVPYSAADWVDTNFDRLDKELLSPLTASTSAPFRSLFDAPWQPSATKDRSISEKFRKEVSRGFLDENGNRVRASLLASLRECSGHFIRCIKPNGVKGPWEFDKNIATTQLLACGVLAAAMVNRTGYPDRPVFDAWLKKYLPAPLAKYSLTAQAMANQIKMGITRRKSALAQHQDDTKNKVQELAKRPFPFGYGLRELKDNFAVATIEMKVEADHTKELHQRMTGTLQFVTGKPAGADDPVPDHDFTVGIERVFFAPGVLHKIATELHPKLLKALDKVVTIQCAFRKGIAKGKLKVRKFDVEVAERRRKEAEAKRKADEEEAARKKAEFESQVASQLSAESAKLLSQAQAAAELAIEERYKADIEKLNEQIERMKADMKEKLAAKDAAAAELKDAHEDAMGELTREMEMAAEMAAKAAAEAAEAHAAELDNTRKSIMSANQERERNMKKDHMEEVALWRALAMQRAAVEQGLMEEIANEMVACIAEWRRIRKQNTLLGKMQGGIADLGVGSGPAGRSKDGSAELTEVLIKQGKKHAAAAKAGTMPGVAPLYHKARFFLRAGATLSKNGAVLIESIELRQAFKSVESYAIAEEECKQLKSEHDALVAGKGDGGISAMFSFVPGAKKPPASAGKGAIDDDDDETSMLEKPLSEGDYGELAKLNKLLVLMTKLKDEAIAAREAVQEAAVDVQ